MVGDRQGGDRGATGEPSRLEHTLIGSARDLPPPEWGRAGEGVNNAVNSVCYRPPPQPSPTRGEGAPAGAVWMAGTSRSALIRALVSLAQRGLLHLAHRVARQRLDEEHALRRLEFRQPPLQRLAN